VVKRSKENNTAGRCPTGVSRVGQCLIARPSVDAGFFAKTVVFIYEDTPAGTAGIVLNKPSNLWLHDLARNAGRDYPKGINCVYAGGPVNSRAVMMLHSAGWFSSNTLDTGTGIAISSDTVMLDKLLDNNTPRHFRLVAGASVWAGGQLDLEIQRNNWLVTPLSENLIFGLDGETQWNSAIEAAGKVFVQSYF
jgi:putative transcriptional regulator